jgi:hypothetical protein
MRCESCRAGDPECHAWIDCDRQLEQLQQEVPQHEFRHVMTESGCSLVYEVGYDEDDPYTEPRRVLVCLPCGTERTAVPLRPAEVRAWVRRRLALLAQQRKAA